MLQDARAREQEKRNQMEERRRALEEADRERREALMKKNQVLCDCVKNHVQTTFQIKKGSTSVGTNALFVVVFFLGARGEDGEATPESFTHTKLCIRKFHSAYD